MHRLAILALVAAILSALVVGAVAYPPATVTSDGNSITLGNLDCGQRYRVRIQERRSGLWSDLQTIDRTLAACPPPADTTPPDTTIDAGPSGTVNTADASFEFSSNEPGSTFEARLDGGDWQAADSPKRYQGLADGEHTFEVRAKDQAGNVDQSPAGRTWTVDTTVPPPPSSLELTAVDGGAAYYGQFSQPLSTGPNYFPIGAWFRPAEAHQIPLYTDFGMNLFVGVENPEGADEAAIRQGGMRSLIYVGERTRFNDLGSEVAGWLLDDEVDMRFGPGLDTTGCTGAGYDVMRNANGQAPDDGKARYANYGKGVYMWETDAQAQCFVNRFQDFQSADMYWHTDPNERSRPEYGKSSGYGKTVDRLRVLDAFDGQRKPIWNFVETAWPWTENPADFGGRILPAEARAAVWHSIIAGARGVLYFDHQFNGTCTNTVIRGECHQDTHDTLKATNQQIQSLASVLNAPTVTGGSQTTATIRSLVKAHSGSLYVFAGSRENVGSVGTVTIPCVVAGQAEVLGENRTVSVSNGSVSDDFANGNAVHIYRVDGQGCGV